MAKTFTTIKPTHKPIAAYFAARDTFARHHVAHESAVRSAFQQLLGSTASLHGWTLIPELRMKSTGGKTVIPDGTLKDIFNLPRGYWESKDESDDLDEEIEKKRKLGYPLSNTIFEDGQRAVLFQNNAVTLDADIRDPAKLADLLNLFYAHAEPPIEEFNAAVTEFKERVPDVGKALADIIADAHKTNAKFQAAFDKFFELCRTSLNPNIATAAVDEMLVQHLMTERIIREVFRNSDFFHQNVIAVEIEKVITALKSKSFSREQFFKGLDRFYLAIERAAGEIEDFSEKQKFLNNVYERFFQGYSVKLADTMGIVYTPQQIVDFMCASVVEVLETEFGKTLGDKDVHILDPCTGTGNFIVNLLRRIPKKDLPRVYKEQLFANEIMLLPYYIAALNIEHEYFERTGTYEPFEGLCFVDTLDLAEHRQAQLSFMTEANTARVERQKRAPITVIIGNPPYNAGQMVHNERNQNRPYAVIDQRVSSTYGTDSAATSVSKLNDPYVKFFRWATDRLGDRDGIVCYVSNNSFIDQIAFDGMRKHVQADFDVIYHVDLEGSVRQNPTLSGTQYNVFGIQVGVGITLAVRRRRSQRHRILYRNVEKNLRRTEKLRTIAEFGSIRTVEWTELTSSSKHDWFEPEHTAEFERFIPIASKAVRADAAAVGAVFKDYSLGVATHRESYFQNLWTAVTG